MEDLGEWDHSVWYRGRMHTINQSGWVAHKFTRPDEIWGKISVERATEWWVQVDVPSQKLSGWIVNPKARGMDYDGMDANATIENRITDIEKLIAGGDYLVANDLLIPIVEELDRIKDNLEPVIGMKEVPEKWKRSFGKFMEMIDKKQSYQ